jgi:hypothetical protein
MAGGIAILLLVIVAAIVAVGGFSLYTTGGFLWWRKTDPRGDRVEADRDGETRPQHTRPTTPAQEGTQFVGGDD